MFRKKVTLCSPRCTLAACVLAGVVRAGPAEVPAPTERVRRGDGRTVSAPHLHRLSAGRRRYGRDNTHVATLLFVPSTMHFISLYLTISPLYLPSQRMIVFRILNGYENIARNIFSHLRKIVELEDAR